MKKFVLVFLILCIYPTYAFANAALDASMAEWVKQSGIIPGPVYLQGKRSTAYRKQLEDAFDKKYYKNGKYNYGVGAYQREVLEPYSRREFETFWIKEDHSCVWLDSDGKEWKCTPMCELLERPPSD